MDQDTQQRKTAAYTANRNKEATTMYEIRENLNSLALWMKIVLCIFSGGLYGAVYRFCSGTKQGLFVGLIWPFVNAALCGVPSIIDIITVCTDGKPTLFTD